MHHLRDDHGLGHRHFVILSITHSRPAARLISHIEEGKDILSVVIRPITFLAWGIIAIVAGAAFYATASPNNTTHIVESFTMSVIGGSTVLVCILYVTIRVGQFLAARQVMRDRRYVIRETDYSFQTIMRRPLHELFPFVDEMPRMSVIDYAMTDPIAAEILERYFIGTTWEDQQLRTLAATDEERECLIRRVEYRAANTLAHIMRAVQHQRNQLAVTTTS